MNAGRTLLRFAGFLSALLIGSQSAQAANRTWDGGGSDDNWNSSANWNAAVSPTGDTLIFAGGTRLNTINNVVTSTTGITFNTNAGAFVLGGAAGFTSITLAGNIDNNGTDSTLQTINLNLILNQDRSITLNGSSKLQIDGIISQSSGNRSLSVNSGNNDNGTLTLSGNNTFSGGLTLSGGTLVLGHDSAAGSGTLTLASGTIQGAGGTRTITNNLSIGGNLTFSGSESLEFSDSFDQNGNRTYTVNNTTTFSGALSGGDNLTKNGTGTLVLGGSNSIDTVTVNTGGALRVANNGALGTTGFGTVVDSGGSLELIGGRTIGAEALSLSGTGVSTGGALRNVSGDNSWSGAITLANVTGVHRINSDAGLLTISGGISETGTSNNKDLTFGGSGNVLVTGNITASGGDMRLFKDGSGTLTLSGTNTYDGATTLRAGTLAVATIGNGDVAGNLGEASSAAANLVFDGGTLRYTGATASTNRNFTINADKVATFEISANTLTISGASTSTNGGLTKSGAGVLTLTGNNLHTGDTIINAGTLKLDGGGNVASTHIIVGDAGSSGAVLDVTTMTGGLIVASGKTVSGIGTIQGSTTIQGILAPGNSTGILNNLGNIELEGTSTFQMEIGGTVAGTGYDQLNVTGSVTLAGLLAINTGLFSPTNGDLFFLIANDGTDDIAGVFSNANYDTSTSFMLGGQEWLISYKADFGSNTFDSLTGNDVALMAVPEPHAALIGGIGVLFLLRRRRA